jgi:hypothetical protein
MDKYTSSSVSMALTMNFITHSSLLPQTDQFIPAQQMADSGVSIAFLILLANESPMDEILKFVGLELMKMWSLFNNQSKFSGNANHPCKTLINISYLNIHIYFTSL